MECEDDQKYNNMQKEQMDKNVGNMSLPLK